ncbi:class I SAM-dependent methyltransferase [Mesorhizobium sp. CU2]|uniref:class I SAM-dependent methyltransferase n=1 Tax=unclassified Mesorhizobium TaxID=325217 RepID=UPI00112C6D9C|nr:MULTISPECIES: class I SAM-dependent methyltransferase [unclassified Mesorhizobium]TPN79548.1 class I SAM-dependent methyltransferase [Mesorhizobium sp. CU3]TPO20021.1 class I SAM-dependent methyltransferase [Mesorhizobium sp. CU2]
MTSSIPGFFQGTEMPSATWWEALWPDPAGVLSATGFKPGMNAVDLCCGDGWFTLPMTRLASHVTAIDIDAEQLDFARRRLAETGVAGCDFVAGDAYALAELVSRPSDFIFMANAFHGVPDRPRLTRAVAAVLVAAGRFVIVNWHQKPRETTKVLGEPRGPRTELRLSPEQTIADAEAGGLRLTALVDVPPYHYGAVFAKAGQ